MPCDEMSADWAAQRIKGLSLWGAVVDGLKRSLGLNKRPNDGMQAKTLLEEFRYPRLGPGMMWDAARDHVVAGGNCVLMGHALKQLASRRRRRLAARCRDRRWRGADHPRQPRDQLGPDARAGGAAFPRARRGAGRQRS